MNHISNLSANYPKSAIRDMFRIAANYSDTVNLCNGEPNFETPDHIKEAACKALRDGMTKYATEPGLLSMREAVADKYTEQFGTHYTPENWKDARTKIDYLKKLKSLAAASGTRDSFLAAMKEKYPQYSGENYLSMTAGFFFA